MKTNRPSRLSSSGMDLRRINSGFTLVELMTVITIVAILLAVGIPSFRSFILSQRVKTASSDIFFALTLARSEAIKRNAAVTVTRAAGGWQDGWAITTGAGPTILSEHGAFTDLTVAGSQNSLTYGANGRLTGTTAPTFMVTGDSTSRCVSIELSGLPKTKKGSC